MLDGGTGQLHLTGHTHTTQQQQFTRQGYQHFDTSPAPPVIIQSDHRRVMVAVRLFCVTIHLLYSRGIGGGTARGSERARGTSSPGSMGLCTMNQFFPPLGEGVCTSDEFYILTLYYVHYRYNMYTTRVLQKYL